MEEQEEKMERTFMVRCSRQQLIDLGNWMYDHGIFFQKVPSESEGKKETDGSIRP